jgi:hypothetical protein
MTYGTETIRPVQKIFGPGNAYVVEAKRQAFGAVAIDSAARAERDSRARLTHRRNPRGSPPICSRKPNTGRAASWFS